MTHLVDAHDVDFAWMLDGPQAHSTRGWRLAPGGIDAPEVVGWVRRLTASVRAAHDRGSWLIVEGSEVVGHCGYKHAPDADGAVEIGYGVAASRQRRGHATRAVAALLAEAASDAKVRLVVAQTAMNNRASQAVLKRNGFVRAGEAWSEDDGAMLVWHRPSLSSRQG